MATLSLITAPEADQSNDEARCDNDRQQCDGNVETRLYSCVLYRLWNQINTLFLSLASRLDNAICRLFSILPRESCYIVFLTGWLPWISTASALQSSLPASRPCPARPCPCHAGWSNILITAANLWNTAESIKCCLPGSIKNEHTIEYVHCGSKTCSKLLTLTYIVRLLPETLQLAVLFPF